MERACGLVLGARPRPDHAQISRSVAIRPKRLACTVITMVDGKRSLGGGLAAGGCAVAMWLAPASAVRADVTGVVRDALTNQPLEGALVSVQATDWETVTAADGSFSLPDAVGDGLVIVAAFRGYFYGSSVQSAPAMNVELLLDQVPVVDSATYEYGSPTDCLPCHPTQLRNWVSSPMAKAGDNAWVQDIYDGTATPGGDGGYVYVRDSPHATDNPSSECAACHEPESWVNQPSSPLGDYAMPSLAKQHGVSCEICHMMAEIDTTRPNFPGIYDAVVSLTRPDTPDWTVQYGVLGDVDFVSDGKMRASYQPQIPAEMCAACHQDRNDHDGDGDFEDEGGVVSEPTYLEWAQSEYGDPTSPRFRTCAGCHMPALDLTAACEDLSDLGRPPGEVRSHEIRGTSPEFLENAVSLELATSVGTETVDVEVTITNDQTGHHVPTGVTIRNMILLVSAVRESDDLELTFGADQTVHDLGGVGDPDQGYYAGRPGKLYGKVNHGVDGTGPVFFTEATGILEDNRIAPLASDTTHYTFAIPEGGGDVRVMARLIYRRSWRVLIDAKAWTEDGHGNPLADVTAPDFGHLMESAEEVVTVPGEGEGGDLSPTCTDSPCDSDGAPNTDSGGGEPSSGPACGCVAAPTGSAAWYAAMWLLIAARLRPCRPKTRPGASAPP